ncbi:MAG: hypothetical protein QM729_00030 [Solirubrobacterales bacterium]
MSRRRRLLRLYVRAGRVYWAWAPTLLALAVLVFVPLGFLDGLLHGVDTSALTLSSGLRVASFVLAWAAVTASSLFGEVFFSGAIAASLTHPEDQEAPGFMRLARHISYGKLIAVDILFTAAVVVGLVGLLVGALLVYVYLGLAGPLVEIEKHSVLGGFRRSFDLVRGHFWMVFAVLIPIEILGDAINGAIVGLCHDALGHGFFAAWVGESLGNIVTTPPLAVVIVLLTLELIHHHDGAGPALNRRPEPITTVPETA